MENHQVIARIMCPYCPVVETKPNCPVISVLCDSCKEDFPKFKRLLAYYSTLNVLRELRMKYGEYISEYKMVEKEIFNSRFSVIDNVLKHQASHSALIEQLVDDSSQSEREVQKQEDSTE